MQAVKFIREIHSAEVDAWLTDRGIPTIPYTFFPETGRIVPGKAALFLYKTDSKLGFAENLVSNPKEKDSSEAINACVAAIESDAKEAGIEIINSFSCIGRVNKIAERLGYKVSEDSYRRISKRL